MPDLAFEVAVADGRVWPCPGCERDREFVQPPCADGHTEDGGECPEWVCVHCGVALLAGTTATAVAVGAHRAA